MKFRSSKVSWTADASGEWLCLRLDKAADAAAALPPADYDVEIKKHREKRSLSANSYYWVLLSRLAEACGVSRNYMHNTLLGRYGQLEAVSGECVYLSIPDTEIAAKTVKEADTYHLRPTSLVNTMPNGEIRRTYLLLRGSSTYDSKEMASLIEGLVSECKEVGIETLTPEELARLQYD